MKFKLALICFVSGLILAQSPTTIMRDLTIAKVGYPAHADSFSVYQVSSEHPPSLAKLKDRLNGLNGLHQQIDDKELFVFEVSGKRVCWISPDGMVHLSKGVNATDVIAGIVAVEYEVQATH